MANKQIEELNAQVEEQANAEVANTDIFAQFMGESVEKSREDVIKELLASGSAKRINGLTIRNVVDTKMTEHTLLTFVVKEWVVGTVKTGTDQFGVDTLGLGKTHNVQTSSFAVAGVMKDNPKLAIFANKLVDDTSLAVDLFAGAKMDIVMQFVPEHTDYINPFASNPTVTQFERDMVIHHVVRLELGPVGEDKYREYIRR